MNQETPNVKSNTSPFHNLPNEIVDEILFYVFQEATLQELSSTNSTYEEFTPFFDSQAFEEVDEEKVRLTLYKHMLGDLAHGFLEMSMQLEGNIRYALGRALMDFEGKIRKRSKIVEKILKMAKKRL